ncbi:Capsule biosynthesis protein capA [Enhygromyxa salina]|uniref:Capsule biosynthesis protein capA n=1 Tax=Enhygromyxa salina TaxID=215803 RepID=A0A0C2D5G8_9BACT|nr:Capsule biosynthesis protein capA [Enhygromyxa salina]
MSLAVASPVQAGYQFDDDESDYQDLVLATPIALEGRVIDAQGMPIMGAQLRLIAWGDSLINDGEATMAWEAGDFQLAGLARRNVLLEVSMDGYYTEILPVSLQVELGEAAVDLGDIELVAEQFGRARLTFGGDTMFDRRMFDDGVLHLNNLSEDTQALFRYIQPLLQADDHTSINLETPVTDDFSTPHPNKSYVFAAYPESAAELPGVGIDSVSLGNNHIYDYLEIGVSDTLFHLDAIGLPYFGAGMNPNAAAATKLRSDINGVEISLQGFSNFIGYSYGPLYEVVTRSNPFKAGALPSFSANLDDFVDTEVAAGRFAIPVIHGGDEYKWVQNSGSHYDFERLVDHGAGLVIAHHPHVAHGVSVIDAGDGPRFVFGSLGNLVFDQEVYETMRSYLAIVDINEGPSGPEVERVQLAPYRLDGYIPRPLVGAGLADMGRHLAHLSTAEAPVSGFGRAVVFAEGGRLVVAADESDVQTTDLIDARSLTVASGSTGLVSLDPYTDTDALAALSSSAAATCELGLDLLGIGDFEDPDVDDAYLEGDLWVQSSARYVQGSETYNGNGAAVLLRKSTYNDRTSLWMGNKVEIKGNRPITVAGWHKGDNAGEFRITVRWLSSAGNTVAHTTEYQNFSANYDWSRFAINLTPPNGADSMQVYYRHYPPNSGGEGQVFLDDLSYIEWDPNTVAVNSQAVSLATPNAWDFVRCSAGNGPLSLNLTHRVYESN